MYTFYSTGKTLKARNASEIPFLKHNLTFSSYIMTYIYILLTYQSMYKMLVCISFMLQA